jgi:hypothetical protein
VKLPARSTSQTNSLVSARRERNRCSLRSKPSMSLDDYTDVMPVADIDEMRVIVVLSED